jgi:hypothetical protein
VTCAIEAEGGASGAPTAATGSGGGRCGRAQRPPERGCGRRSSRWIQKDER